MSSAPDARPTVKRCSTSAQKEFVDLDNDALEDVGGVDLVFDVGAGCRRQAVCTRLIRGGGTLVSVVRPPVPHGPTTAWQSISLSRPIAPNW